MALLLNGVEVSKLVVNNVECDLGYLNGTQVFSGNAQFRIRVAAGYSGYQIKYKTGAWSSVYPNASGDFNMILPSNAIASDVSVNFTVAASTNIEYQGSIGKNAEGYFPSGIFASVSQRYMATTVYNEEIKNATELYGTYRYIPSGGNLSDPNVITYTGTTNKIVVAAGSLNYGDDLVFYPDADHGASRFHSWSALYYLRKITTPAYPVTTGIISLTRI